MNWDQLGTLFRYTLYILFIPFWHLQRLVPRDEHTWIFGSWKGSKLADNTMALYEYVIQEHPEINCIWLSDRQEIIDSLRAKGRETYAKNSWKAFWVSLRARAFFSCSGKEDLNRFAMNGGLSFQLWHGLPLKKISLDDRYSDHKSFFNRFKKLFLPFQYEFNWDFLINTAPLFQSKFASAFGIATSQVLTTGYPRNDVLFTGSDPQMIQDLRRKHPGVKVISYIPTFRTENEEADLFHPYGFKVKEAEAILNELNAVLLVKAHPVQARLFPSESLSENSRIISVADDAFFDMNTFLVGCDCLITDYSSVFFDYLLCDRPIIFAPFDLQTYLSKHRELYFPYEQAVAGPICNSWKSVWEELRLLDEDNYRELRKEKLDKYHTFKDKNSSKRLFESAIELLSD